MPKFNVTVLEIHKAEIRDVEAANEDEARAIVAKMIEDDEEAVGEDEFEYHRTMETYDWPVDKA